VLLLQLLPSSAQDYKKRSSSAVASPLTPLLQALQHLLTAQTAAAAVTFHTAVGVSPRERSDSVCSSSSNNSSYSDSSSDSSDSHDDSDTSSRGSSSRRNGCAASARNVPKSARSFTDAGRLEDALTLTESSSNVAAGASPTASSLQEADTVALVFKHLNPPLRE
jgi:hypothetical protein